MKLLTIRETPAIKLSNDLNISLSFTSDDYKIGIFDKDSGFYYSNNKLYVNNRNMYSNVNLNGAIALSFNIGHDPFGFNVCTSIISSKYNLLTPVFGRFGNLELSLRIEGEVDIHSIYIAEISSRLERITTTDELFNYSSI